jgi:hypothetical protein
MENELKKQIEILKKFIDNDLLLLEIHDVIAKKNEAVRKENYQLAYNLRQKEIYLLSKLPKLCTLKKLRSKLL